MIVHLLSRMPTTGSFYYVGTGLPLYPQTPAGLSPRFLNYLRIVERCETKAGGMAQKSLQTAYVRFVCENDPEGQELAL